MSGEELQESKTEILGHIVFYEDDDDFLILDDNFMWQDFSKSDHATPEDALVERVVLTDQQVAQIRKFIRMRQWEGPIPTKLYPATWSKEEGTEVTGKPIPFNSPSPQTVKIDGGDGNDRFNLAP